MRSTRINIKSIPSALSIIYYIDYNLHVHVTRMHMTLTKHLNRLNTRERAKSQPEIGGGKRARARVRMDNTWPTIS